MHFSLCVFLAVVSTAVVIQANSNQSDVDAREKRSNVCYDGLGCFSNESPFRSLQRPLSVLPESPQVIDPKFLLFTRDFIGTSSITAQRGYRLTAGDAPDLMASTFKASRLTKFLVHGFIDNTLLGAWMEDATREFLQHGDYNVVVVDWGQGSLATYSQATANTRVVGAMIAQLITFMEETTGARPEDMHILGHSLGSHIAGYAGERLHNLGRITGLDPAEPYFQGTETVVRLDPSDALFVDIIHTDAAGFFSTKLGLGMSQTCGHVDFYVNGGHDQPGCEGMPHFTLPISNILQNGLIDGTREVVACNHIRAYHLFIESINTKCPFKGYRCASEDDFNSGTCLPCSGDDCGYMGLHADRAKPTAAPATSKYYLLTGSKTPYCRYHYKLALTFASTHSAQAERGHLYAKLGGSLGMTDEVELTTEPIYVHPGSTYTYVMTSQVELGEVRLLDFRWEHKSSVTDPASWNPLGLRDPTLYVDRAQIFSGEADKRVSLCGHGASVASERTFVIAGDCGDAIIG